MFSETLVLVYFRGNKTWIIAFAERFLISILKSNLKPMKKTKILFYVLVIVLFASCARAVTPYEAAHHTYKKCRDMK